MFLCRGDEMWGVMRPEGKVLGFAKNWRKKEKGETDTGCILVIVAEMSRQSSQRV